jgi:hypothetical protein
MWQAPSVVVLGAKGLPHGPSRRRERTLMVALRHPRPATKRGYQDREEERIGFRRWRGLCAAKLRKTAVTLPPFYFFAEGPHCE